MILGIYFLAAFLLLTFAYGTFRIFVRRDYQGKGRLTPLSSLLELLVWGFYMAFPYTFNPPDWPYFWSFTGTTTQVVGLVVIILGMILAFGTMLWFGLRRAFGLEISALIQWGPYRLSRNPQIVGGSWMVIGVALQWPTWYSLGWVFMYAAVAHMMVLTEEEFLQDVFGQEYERYCERVPRYLGLQRKPQRQL